MPRLYRHQLMSRKKKPQNVHSDAFLPMSWMDTRAHMKTSINSINIISTPSWACRYLSTGHHHRLVLPTSPCPYPQNRNKLVRCVVLWWPETVLRWSFIGWRVGGVTMSRTTEQPEMMMTLGRDLHIQSKWEGHNNLWIGKVLNFT